MRLLIIGEFTKEFQAAKTIAISKGADVMHVDSIDKACENLRICSAELIMIDVSQNIALLINNLLAEHISIPVIACGFANDTIKAVNAIKAGAKEYITLPPNEELIAAIIAELANSKDIIKSKSTSMIDVFKLVDQVASSDANILITGESGTGKEIISKYIHSKSKRSGGKFISVNCAAIPENLLESELFGHEKGAFTGAIARRTGKFEESSGGTLLLDEISEIDIKLQAKLLRALQEREIDRIGGSSPIKLNLRIIATSNRDLQKEVREGRFREDLYFRLNIINVKLPKLTNRREDILTLAEYFINKYSNLNNIPVRNLSLEAKNMVLEYSWPGNIRELENSLYRAVLLASDQYIEPQNLMLEIQSSGEFIAKTIEAAEKDLINHTYKHCLGNEISAANILGITINQLRAKLKYYTENG